MTGRKVFRMGVRAAALFCAVLLAGCYASETPFIGAEEAEYPFGDAAHYRRGTLPETEDFETGTMVRTEDGYSMMDDGSDETATIRFKRLEGEYYAVQEPEPADSNGVIRYLYDLARIDGNTLSVLGARCGTDDQRFLDSGAIVRTDGPLDDQPYCFVRDWDGLAEILLAKQPELTPEIYYIFE